MAEERLQKILANAGIASRRKAEELIVSGHVSVNGVTVTALGSKADLDVDEVKCDGQRLKAPKHHVYFALNKPKNVMTTVNDPERRETVMHFFKGLKERIYPVGRLDYASEGLLLLTNDGEFANLISSPEAHVPKTYLVKVNGILTAEQQETFRRGIPMHGKRTAPAKLKVVRSTVNPWYEVTLAEGRQNQIRIMFKHFGFLVEKLRRIKIGFLELGDLKGGAYRTLTREEVQRFRRLLKMGEGGAEETAKQSGAEPVKNAQPARKQPEPTGESSRSVRASGQPYRGSRPPVRNFRDRDAVGKPPRSPRSFDQRDTGARPPGRNFRDASATGPRTRSPREAMGPERDAAGSERPASMARPTRQQFRGPRPPMSSQGERPSDSTQSAPPSRGPRGPMRPDRNADSERRSASTARPTGQQSRGPRPPMRSSQGARPPNSGRFDRGPRPPARNFRDSNSAAPPSRGPRGPVRPGRHADSERPSASTPPRTGQQFRGPRPPEQAGRSSRSSAETGRSSRAPFRAGDGAADRPPSRGGRPFGKSAGGPRGGAKNFGGAKPAGPGSRSPRPPMRDSRNSRPNTSKGRRPTNE